MKLFPKSQRFFDMFERAANNVLEGAKLLDDFFANHADWSVKVKRIEDAEHAGDQITHDTMEILNKTFNSCYRKQK